MQLSYSQRRVRKASIVLMGLNGAFLTAEPLAENKQIIGNLSEFIYGEPSKHAWIEFLSFVLASSGWYFSLDLIHSQQTTWIC